MKDNDNLSKRVSDIEDRIAIKNLVDTFSILSDQKETQKQTLLFTENATVETLRNCFKTYLTDLDSSNMEIEYAIHCLPERFLDKLNFT